jgi:transcriptional regulator with XRE-family HTH domain
MHSGITNTPQPDADAADTAARIGKTIRNHRENHGWSQFALARMVNVDQSCISQLELGRRQNINLVLVAAIAHKLGTRLANVLAPPLDIELTDEDLPS